MLVGQGEGVGTGELPWNWLEGDSKVSVSTQNTATARLRPLAVSIEAPEASALDRVAERLDQISQHRVGPIAAPGPVGPANRGGDGPGGGLAAEHLEPVRPRAGVQRRTSAPQLSREVVSKPRGARFPTKKQLVEPAHSGETLATP